jgi:hypothetical protein
VFWFWRAGNDPLSASFPRNNKLLQTRTEETQVTLSFLRGKSFPGIFCFDDRSEGGGVEDGGKQVRTFFGFMARQQEDDLV